MNQIYTKTHIGISTKAFFMKMYLLIKSIIANFYDKAGDVSADDSLEISFSSTSSTLSVTKETKGFSNLLSRVFSRFYSRSGYRDLGVALSLLLFTLISIQGYGQGTCTSPTASVNHVGLKSSYNINDASLCNTVTLNPSDNFTITGIVHTDAQGKLGVAYVYWFHATTFPVNNTTSCGNAIAGSLTYSLHLSSAGQCTGATIPATTANGGLNTGGFAGLNPEWTGLQPNTDYIFSVSGTVGSTCIDMYRSCIYDYGFPCAAGSVAPAISNTNPANICPATTVNLNSLVTSSTPGGTSLVWFNNNAHTGSAYGTPTTATAGTYYAFYYDAANDCYSPASAVVTANAGGCSTNILALANSVFVDNGVGGGTAGNCLRDGTESSNGLVTGLSVNLVSGSTVAYSAPIAVDGSYQLLNVANGSYTMIISNSPTSTSLLLPTGWSMSSGTGSTAVIVTGGNLITPASAPSFCLKYCPVISTVTPASPTVCGLTDGSITLVGLRPGVSYAISYVKDGGSPITSTVIANATGEVIIASLGSGVYTAITANEGGCASTPVTATVDDPAGPNISGTLKNDPTSCTGSGAFGNITLQGLTPTTVYTVGYFKDAATTETTGTFTSDGTGNILLPSLTSGVYSNITATLHGCASAPIDVTLVGPTPPAAPILGVSTLANACPATSVNLLTLSGTPPNGRTHEWHNANNTLPASLEAAPTTVSASGTYYVFAKGNASGCYSSGTPVTVTIAVCTATLTAPANTVYNDNGAGGGFTGNCIKDGTESATGLPGGLYINLIQGGLLKYSTAVNVDGSYVLSGVLDGTYDLIIANSATATTSALPANFGLSSGASTVSVTITNSALASPAALPSFCVRQNPTCDSINGTISVTPTGGTLGAGMTQKYLLLTPAGLILQESNVPTFVGLPAGNYNVVAIVYDIKPYTIGANISAVSTSACIGISAPVNFTVCGSSIAAVAGSVYTDNGAGGGTANDCIQNGTEITSPIPSGLFVNLVQGSTVVKSAAVQADGSYVVPSILDGSYNLIITNSATAATSILPVTWTSGITSVAVTVAGGSVVTPSPAPKFCLRQGFPDVVVTLSQPTTTLVENAVSQLPVSVVNQGVAAATGPLTFTATLPNSLSAPATFIDNGWTCITVLQTVSCTNSNTGDLAPLANRNFNIPITSVIGSAGQTPPVVGTVSPVVNEQIIPNNTSLVTVLTPIVAMPRPDLVTTIGQPNPAFQEELPSDIPVTITNQGNAPATGNLTFTTALPNSYRAPSLFTSNGWICLTSGQTVTCTNPNTSSIAPLASVTFDIPLTPVIGTNGTSTPISGTVTPVLNENVTPNNTAMMTPLIGVAPVTRPDLVTTIGQPSVALVEGQSSNIPVTIANNGNEDATGTLTFTSNLPNGYSAPAIFTQNGWTCLTSGQTVTCTNPNTTGLGQSASTTFNIPITPAIGTAGSSLPVSGTIAPVSGEVVFPNNSASMVPALPVSPMPRPDLVTTIGQPSPALTEGVPSNIPVTVTNQGNAPGTGPLTFTTTLPLGLTSPASFTNGGWICSTLGQVVTCSTPNATGLLPTAATTFNIPVTPAIGTSGSSPIVSGTTAPVPTEATLPNNTASILTGPVQIGARPDVVTTIGQPSPVLTEGVTSNIPVTLTNQGNAPARGPLTFTTTLPGGLTAPATFGINGWTCNTSIQTVTCTNPNTGDLAPTATTTFNIPVTPALGTGGTTPTILGSAAPVPNETTFPNNIAALTPTAPIAMGLRPDLVTTLSQATPNMIEGIQSSLPVSISNQGTAPATGILTFTTNLPNGLTAPASFTDGAWSCTTSGQLVSCTNPNTSGLVPTGISNFSIPVTPAIGTAGTSPSIVGSVNVAPNENITPNNTASITISPAIQMGARPDVVTTIGQPSPVLQEGITSNIPVTLTNVGNAPATGPLTFTTNLPNGLTAPATFGQNGWTCITSGQTVSCSNPNTGNLAPVGITTFNIPVTPQGGTAGTFPTLIGSVAPVPNENTYPNNIGIMTPTQAILPAARPDIVASIGQPSPTLTEGITSNIPVTLTNQGNATGNGPLTFTTTLPNSLTAPSSFTDGAWTCSTSGQTVTCTTPNTAGLVPTAVTLFNIPVTPIVGSAGQTPSVVGTSTPLSNENVVGNNTATVTAGPIAPMARPDLTLTFGQPSPALKEGSPSNLPVTVTNIGNAPGTGPLTFTTTLPNGYSAPATFVDGPWTCTTSGQLVTCGTPNTSGIVPSGNTSLNIPITPAGGTVGTTPILSGTVATVPNETGLANNTGSISPTLPVAPMLRPDLTTTIGQPSPVLTEGVTSLIPVTVTSIGTAPAMGPLTFTTTLANGLTAPASFANGGWTCTTSGQTVSCSTPNAAGLAPTQVTNFNIPVTPAVGSAGTTPTISGTVAPAPDETTLPNNTGSMTPTAPIAPMLRPDLVTTIGQPSPALTEGITSLIPVTVTSVGTAPATGPLTFTTTLANGLTAPASFTDGAWTCSTSGQVVSCSTPNAAGLAPTAVTAFNIPVTPAVGSAGTIPVITGTVAPAPNETTTPNNTGSMTPTEPIAPMLRPDLVTTIGQPSPALTEGVTSLIPVTVTSIGTAPATGPLTFTTTLANGLTAPATFANGGWTCSTSGQTVTCSTPNAAGLAPTQLTNFDIPVTPTVGTAGTTPNFMGTATPVPTEASTPNNTGNMTPSAPIAPMARPDLTLTFGQPTPALTEGSPSNLPVTVTNIGNAPATGPLTFTTALPNGYSAPATFIDGPWTCITSGQSVTCTSPNTSGILPTGNTSLNIPITPAASTVGTIPTLSGMVSPVPNETSLANNSGSVSPSLPVAPMLRPDLTTTIGQPSPVLTEGVISLIPVTVTSVGTAPATGPLTFTTTLANGLTAPAAFSNGAWTCTTSGQTVSCSTPNTTGLAPTQVTAFNIPVTPSVGSAGTTPTITGTVAPAPNETTLPNNTGTMTPTAPIAAALSPDLVTTIGQPSPVLTEGVTSLIPVTVTSVGTAPATGPLTFTTTLANGLTAPASFSNGGWVCTTSGQTVSCSTPNAAGLAPTAVTAFNIPVTPAIGTAGTTPTITGTTAPVPTETTTANNTGTMTPTAPIAAGVKPDLTTTIGQASPVLTEGVTSLIPVTVTSVGTAPATGPLTFTTILANGLIAPASFSNGGWVCTTSGQTVSCSTPNAAGLAPTAVTAFNIPVTPAIGTAGTTPTITGTTAPVPTETTTANNTGTMTPVAPIAAGTSPDLALSFGTPSPAFTVNIPSTVSVTVTNVGTASATGQLVLTFNIPNNTTSPLSYSAGNGWVCNASGAILTCANTNSGGLATTATSTFNIQLTPNANTAGQSVILNGTVTPANGETVLPNNTSVVVVPLPISGGAVVLTIKAMLQGALVNSTGGLMRDDLRTKSLIPSSQPYSSTNGFTQVNGGGAETVASAVLTTSGNNAIVDWVMVELRSAITPATVLATRSALIQRDGDIVDVDGVSPVTFTNAAVTWGSQYYVSVRHRNHLGVMTAAPITVTSTTPVVDFTSSALGNYKFPTSDLRRSNAPQVTQSGVQAMWAGNSSVDNKVVFQGPNNDPDAIFFDVLGDGANTSQIVNFIRNNVYSSSDLDMNGKVIFQGPTNEVDVIFFEVFGHPENVNQILNFIIWQQLP